MTARSAASLRASVDICRGRGQEVVFWWRDDDLISDASTLHSLAEVGHRSGVEPLMAVIPGRAHAALGDTLAGLQNRPWFAQHGYVHANHESHAGFSSEFGEGRVGLAGLRQIAEGRAILLAMGLPRFLDVFVPPWNHLHPAFLPLLPRLGFSGVSGYFGHTEFTDEEAGQVGLAVRHAGIDATHWGLRPQMLDPDKLVAKIVSLIGRDVYRRDVARPIRVGILTHHRVMNDREFGVLEALFETISATPGVRWLLPPDVFA